MELSSKDKKLLVYLLAISLIAGSYLFAARPLLDKQAELSMENELLRTQVNHYSSIYNNRAEYENRIIDAQTKYNEIVNKFFGGLNQDNTIMLIDGIEKSSDVWIARLAFQEESIMENAESTAASEDGETEETEISEPETSSVTGYRQDLNIDYAANYDNFKKFIEYVENYDERLFITSISATYAVDSGLVGGNIVLSQFAVLGTDKEYKAPDLSNLQTGKDSIFKTGVAPVNSESQGLNVEGLSMDETEGNPEAGPSVNEEQPSAEPQAASEPTPQPTPEPQEDTIEIEEPQPASKPAGASGGII